MHAWSEGGVLAKYRRERLTSKVLAGGNTIWKIKSS